MSAIYPFATDHDQHLLQLFGAKAKVLCELPALDLKVPNGFVITAAFLFSRDRPEYDEDLRQHLHAIGGFPVAVRSSGALEDLGGASFAGLYDSFLNIDTWDSLVQAITDCFKAASRRQIKKYATDQGFDTGDSVAEGTGSAQPRMSVIVQRMIDPEFAGVGFSLDPVTGQEEWAVIEYVSGLADQLLAGHVEPNRCRIHNASGAIEVQQQQPGGQPSSVQMRQLARCFMKISAHYGAPQDVEWAMTRDGQIWILQARPITRVHWRDDVSDLTDADLKDGGISARVCTPLMFSLYRTAMDHSLGGYFKRLGLLAAADDTQWLYHFYGRAYWNAGKVKMCLQCLPGFAEDAFDRDLGISKDYGVRGPVKTKTTFAGLMRALPVLLRLNWEYRKSRQAIAEFSATFLKWDLTWRALTPETLKVMTWDKFARAFLQLIDTTYLPTEKAYFRTVYNNANFQSTLREKIKTLEASLGTEIDLLALLSGLNNISHLEIQHDLQRLQTCYKRYGRQAVETATAFNHFMERHYHHGDAELDILEPRWGEAPERIWAMAQSESTTRRDAPRSPDTDEQARLAQAAGGVGMRGPYARLQLRALRRQVERARFFLSGRERMREFSTRTYFQVRRFVLEMGIRLHRQHVLARPDDVFFLHLPELRNLAISGPGAMTSLLSETVQQRRLSYCGFKAFRAPHEFGPGIFATKDAPMTKAEREVSRTGAAGSSTSYQGVPSSRGTAVGPVLVAHSLAEAEAGLTAGNEILVVKHTDPGWTPVLGRVAAVVTEVGGVLSHAAVISREYGIPAVLNLPGITTYLRTGQRVLVDGGKGIVTVL